MHKIVIDARVINNSGIGTYLQNVIPNLIKNYELILLGKPDDLKNFPWVGNVKIIDFNSPIYSLSEQFQMPAKIPECDIFLSPHYNIPIFPIRAKKRIVIIHDIYHLVFNRKLTLMQRLYSKIMMRLAVNLSDRIITISEFSKSEIQKYLNVKNSKISIVYFGFDADNFSKQSSDFNTTKNKFNLPAKYILFVSNIKPHKNLYNLLLAFQKILKADAESDINWKNLKLVVVGESKKLVTSDKKSFELIDQNPDLKGKIIFTGFIKKEELVSLYKNASVFVFPSYYEGFGIPPLEAMVCGCPVAASNKASIPEVCGKAVLYINPDDINDIAEKTMKIISDANLRNQLIEKGKENVKRFSNEIFSNSLNETLKLLA